MDAVSAAWRTYYDWQAVLPLLVRYDIRRALGRYRMERSICAESVVDSQCGLIHIQLKRCMELARRLPELTPSALLKQLRNELTEPRQCSCPAEVLALRSVWMEMLAHALRLVGADDRQDVGRAFIALANSSRSADWECIARQVIEAYERALLLEGPRTQRPLPPLVRRALLLIAENYCDKRLDEVALASLLAISTSRLRYLMKSCTGKPLSWHLHEKRIRAAVRQIHSSTDTLEVIASRVGYGSAIQMRRRLQQRIGITPREIRSEGLDRAVAVGFLTSVEPAGA